MSVQKGDVFIFQNKKVMFIKKQNSKTYIFYDISEKNYVYLTGMPRGAVETNLELLKKVKKDAKQVFEKLQVGQHFEFNSLKRTCVFVETKNDEVIYFEIGNENKLLITSIFVTIKVLPGINLEFQKKMSLRMFSSLKETKNAIKIKDFDRIFRIACHMASYEGERLKDIKTEVFEIVDYGNIVLGEAYYHEVDQYYTIVGVELKIKSKIKMDTFLIDEECWGFYPIFVGKSHQCAPIIFDESSLERVGSHRYSNGCGDHVTILETFVKKEDVKFNNFNFSDYLKK